MKFSGIKETCIYIHDLEKAKRFYQDILGLPVIHYDKGKHIFFRVGPDVLLCFNPDNSRSKTSPPPHYAEGPQHFAFETTDQEYPEWKQKIESAGIPIIDTLVWANGKESFYFLDPEQNVLEIVPPGIWGSK